jgi:flavorubredoxin
MKRVQLAEGVYWVGAIDWNIRNFHGYSTHVGTTYNAYLIVGHKIALIDTVKLPFLSQLLSRVNQIVPFADIDYVISNHVEMDHSGSLPQVMREAKRAKLITLEKFGEGGLKKHFYCDWPTIPVKEGSELDLGKRKLTFIPTPMLHWPDSMCTYLIDDKILFSMDAFGQHLATSKRFDDEVGLDAIMPQAAKYYANILMPFGDLIVKAVEKLSSVDIHMIAPSHGVIWRSHLNDIVSAYASWGKGDSIPKALVIYDTMWGSTEKMALALSEGIASEGVEVKVYNLTDSDKSDIIKEVLDARVILVGSPTLNNGIFPSVAEFLCYLKGLKPRNKLGAAFGSYGWSGGAVKAIQQGLEQTGTDVVESDLTIKFVPDQQELCKCTEFGVTMAKKVNSK